MGTPYLIGEYTAGQVVQVTGVLGYQLGGAGDGGSNIRLRNVLQEWEQLVTDSHSGKPRILILGIIPVVNTVFGAGGMGGGAG